MDEKEKAAGASGGIDFTGGSPTIQGDAVGGDKIVYEAPTRVLSALHQLRPPVADFVGREGQIQILVGALRASDRVGLSGIRGLGGIGKTELARTVAYRLRDDYPDAQLWLDLRGTEPVPRPAADVLAACIRALLGPEAKLPEEQDVLASIYLDQLNGKRALIVLDNAADQVQVEPLLPPTGCALLITSREAIAFPGLKPVTLEELALPEARRLLTEIAPRLSDGLADEIGKLCGCLPLALRAAGSLLAVTPDLDPASYAKDLRHERTRLAKIGIFGVNISVEASFHLSYSRLPSATRSLFRRLAVFPGSFDAQAEEAICEDPGHKRLTDLVRRSLVLYDAETRRYRLHDLVRVFADARLEHGDRETAHRRHAGHYMTVAACADDLYLSGGDGVRPGLQRFDADWGNIQAGQSWAAAHAEQGDEAAWLCSAYPAAGAYCVALRLHPREQIRWLEAALSAARRLKDRSAEGPHLGNLGLAYADLGEMRRAIELYDQHLAIAREIGDRQSEGRALGNLGNAYANLNETRRAIEFYELALAIERESSDRRGEGRSLCNLGNTHAALGEVRRAIEFYEQALAIDRESGDRLGEGTDLANLGNAYAELGETRRAIEFCEQHLAIAREIGDHRAEGTTLGNLGRAYADLGETRRAIEFYKQHLVIARQIGDRRGEGRSLGNLGNAHAALGETRRAIKFYEQRVVIAREIGDRGGEANTLWNSSMVLDELGDRAEAIARAEAALQIFEVIEDPTAARVRSQLAEWKKK